MSRLPSIAAPLAAPAARAWSFRTTLLLLTLATLVPFVLLAVAQGVAAARLQQRAVETGLASTAHAVASSTERLLQSSVAVLSTLGDTGTLDDDDLPALYEAARRATLHQPWYAVWLIAPDGRQVFSLARALGSALPALDERRYFQEVVRTGQPAVSSLVQGAVTSRPLVAVAVPLVRGGRLKYVLVAGLRPEALSASLTAAGGVPAGGIASVVGRDHRIIARSRDAARWVGQAAHPVYSSAIAAAPEGVVRSTTVEGQAVYTAFVRLADSGWTVGVGMPAADVERPLRRWLAWTGLLGVTVLLASTGLALVLYRRLAGPMATLAVSARAIAAGSEKVLQVDARIAEVAPLAGALEQAAKANAERRAHAERERGFALQVAEAEDRERRRIAHDLHDDLGQILAAAQIRLAQLCRGGDAEAAAQAGDVLALVDLAASSTRSLAQQLAPAVLDELGLVPALEWLADELAQRFALDVRIDDDGVPKPLRPLARSVVYRCARELLINVAKHAGCGTATLQLRAVGATLWVRVRDSGRGLVPAAAEGGLGLRMVRERINAVGGRLEVRSAPGGGCEAVLQVPLDAGAVDGRGALPA